MTNQSPYKPSEIRVLFDRIAPVYDQLNNWLSLGQHRIWKMMAVKWAEPQPGDHALDVCCGSGDLTQLLARRVGTGGEIIGLDFSSQQLAIARRRAEKEVPHLKIRFIEGNALELPFDDNSFDCATMGYGLRNVTNIPLCLRELHRVLKTGAKVAILDFNQPSQSWLGNLQKWYLQTIVVPVAESFGLTEEYAYISPSLERFPKGKQQVNIAKKVGFTQAVHYPIAGGLMGVLVLTK